MRARSSAAATSPAARASASATTRSARLSASRSAASAASRAARRTSAASASIRAASRISARSPAARSWVAAASAYACARIRSASARASSSSSRRRLAVRAGRALLGLGAPLRALDRRLGLEPHALERALGAGLALGGGALALLDPLPFLAQRLGGVRLREPAADPLEVLVDLVGVVALADRPEGPLHHDTSSTSHHDRPSQGAFGPLAASPPARLHFWTESRFGKQAGIRGPPREPGPVAADPIAIAPDPELAQLIDDFLASQLSPRTRESYAGDLVIFLRWLGERGTHPREVARPDVDRYRNWLAEPIGPDGKPASNGRPRYAPATVARKLSAPCAPSTTTSASAG